MQNILEVLQDTAIDTLKLLPFLFITYLIMEYIEHKTSNKVKQVIQKSGKFGPLLGGIVGIVPQCGFSVSATNLYSARVITLGTLISVYLTTSDEMLPILISEAAPAGLILKILAIKLVVGIIAGFIIDLVINVIGKTKKVEPEEAVGHMCEHDHCDCEHGIFKSALKHTINIFIFITIITFAINTLIHFIGEETIEKAIAGVPVLGILVSSIFGLIPNCAGSVIITELYLSNLISFGSMIAGLLVGSGIGILVLFKSNKNIKENLTITGLLMLVGIIVGLIIDFVI